MYTKEIEFNEYEIEIEYDLSSDQTEAELVRYIVFKDNVEVNIPCVLEVAFLDKRVDKELGKITDREIGEMIQDRDEARGDFAYDLMMDK